MASKKGVPVVITRKDKRLKKGLHLAAFILTSGASASVSAAKAATNAAYNSRTRQLAERAEAADAIDPAGPEAEYSPGADGYGGQFSPAAGFTTPQEARAAVRAWTAWPPDPWPEGRPMPPGGRGWKLASVLAAGTSDQECPRCHRLVSPETNGQPHTVANRMRWCPGSTAFDYIYTSGHLWPVARTSPPSEQAAAGPAPARKAQITAAGHSAAIEARLAEVNRLHDAGVLTEQEHAAKRAEIIREL